LIIFFSMLLGLALGASGLVTVLALASPYVHDAACDPHPGEKFNANAVCTRGSSSAP